MVECFGVLVSCGSIGEAHRLTGKEKRSVAGLICDLTERQLIKPGEIAAWNSPALTTWLADATPL